MMTRMRTAALIILTVVLTAYPLTALAHPAAADSIPPAAAQAPGTAAPPPPAPPQPSGPLATMGGSPGDTPSIELAAVAQARRTGKPVVVPSLTTATTTVTAQPHGGLRLIESGQPIRVRHGNGWVPVSARLRPARGGRWAAAAVPDDAVTFSGGGTGLLADIATAHTSLGLLWHGRLPAPVVSGATATYRSVLPGVDLALTATSADAGGFSLTVIVHSAAAARNARLSRLRLGVVSHGVTLSAAPGGGVLGEASDRSGSYQTPAAMMWDSSADPVSLAAPSASSSREAAAVSAARRLGATLAVPGLEAASSPAGPHLGALVAPVREQVSEDGYALSLLPDASLLAARSARYPVYINPSFAWQTAGGSEQARDEVQASCAGTPHYYKSSPPAYPDPYWALGVGYDGWGDCNGINGWAMAYYQVGVPSQIWGGHINTAVAQTPESWAADCSPAEPASVTLSWTGTIQPTTNWKNAPNPISNLSGAQSIPPDQNSCGGNLNTGTSGQEAVSFNVWPAMVDAARDDWSNFTFRLWQNTTTQDKYTWVKFSALPTLQITYSVTPNVPDDESATANGDGSGNVGCDTSPTNPPAMGSTVSTVPPYLSAELSTSDKKDTLSGTFQYWDQSKTQKQTYTIPGENTVSVKGQVTAELPASFMSSLANGDVVGWQADAGNGKYTSAWSPPCYFAVNPQSPPAPGITDNLGGASASIGSTVKFTLTSGNTSSDPATTFVWGLDDPPVVTGAPADQQITLSSGQTSATLKITVPSPGPHSLWAYALDAAGNESAMSSDDFSAANDPSVTFASFAKALTAGASYDNSMIAAGSGQVNGDGAGDSFAASDLEQAGWQPKSTITEDGASFTLPDFSTSGPDNVLAANQIIDMGGGQGGALVFLATSTDATTAVSGTSTAAADSPLKDDDDAPLVPGGVPVTGFGCTAVTRLDTNQDGCQPATGSITYTDGYTAQYEMAVPDWSSGPEDLAAGDFPHESCVGGNCFLAYHKVYAIAVPLNLQHGGVVSVTLPDVTDTVSATVSGSGVSYQQPALHIFGMALSNSTTVTPGASVTVNQQTAGQAWTPAFSSPIENGYALGSGSWGNQTIRMAVSPSTAVATGGYLRIRLSDPQFQAGAVGQPLEIGAASIAPQAAAGSPKAVSAPQPLSFNGQASVTIPEGSDVYSDPLQLPFALTPGTGLLISLYLENGADLAGQPSAPPAVPYLPGHSWASGATEWVSAAPAKATTSGDETGDTAAAPFTVSGSVTSVATSLLTSVDVTSPVTTSDPDGDPAVVVVGDNLTDPGTTGNQAISDPGAPSTRVAGQLAGLSTAAGFAVSDAGIEDNQVLGDGTTGGGPSLLTRLDRDILAEPDVGTVVIDEGLEDLLQAGPSATVATSMENAYGAISSVLSNFGASVTIATLTPCAGYANTGADDACSDNSGDPPDTCSSTTVPSGLPVSVDLNRDELNLDICGLTIPTYPPPCGADLDGAVSNQASPESLQKADDAGDHANLTAAGYAAMAGAVTQNGACPLAANGNPLPSAPS
jgi:hypothetical protein